MSDFEDVLHIERRLAKLTGNDTADDALAVTLLQALGKHPMTLDVLKRSHIGVTVNNARKRSRSERVVSLARGLVKNWKKLLHGLSALSIILFALNAVNSMTTPEPRLQGTASALSSTLHRGQHSSSCCSTSSISSRSTPVTPSAPGTYVSLTDTPNQHAATAGAEIVGESGGAGNQTTAGCSTGAVLGCTTDGVRLRCREMLATALRSGGSVDGAGDVDVIAAAVEYYIFQETKATDVKYRNRVRSRITNLKDAKNPRLRERLLTGRLSAERVAAMSPDELASDELRSLRAQMTRQAIDDHHMATRSGAKSDLFKCSRCGMRDTTYNQVQTLSGDEPMTTYVLCNHCGKRWKFN